MKSSRSVRLLAACGLALSLFALPIMAAPPTDEQLDSAVAVFGAKRKEAMDAGKRMTREEVKAAADEAVKDIDFSQISVEQLRKLQMVPLALTDKVALVKARLAELSESKTNEGALAGIMAMGYQTGAETTESMTAAARKALNHPNLGSLIAAGGKDGDAALNALVNLLSGPPEVFAATAAAMPTIANSLSDSIGPAALSSAKRMFDAMVQNPETFDETSRETMRTKLLMLANRQLAAIPADAPNREQTETRLKRMVTSLDSNIAKGKFINNPAPDIHFTWSSTQPPISTLADLKGKIVVLDFWATWCGPCTGSFPKVRELAARYKDYPVAIIGVTSLQGSHTPGPLDREKDNTLKRVELKGNPAEELRLMGEYVKSNDVTWTVAFSQEEVFNAEYGVNGIPHVAIIDATGKVRHNGLHPGVDPEKKFAHIDALLKEAGLPFPPPFVKPEEPAKPASN